MIRVKDRILTIKRILRGPFQKHGKVSVRISYRSSLDGSRFKVIPLSLGKVEDEKLDQLGIQVQSTSEGKVGLRFPVEFQLQRAHLWGWETCWEGAHTQSSPSILNLKYLEFALLSEGWWRVSSFSTSIDFHFVSDDEAFERKQSFLAKIKQGVASHTVRMLVASTVFHALFFVSFLSLKDMKLPWVSGPAEMEVPVDQAKSTVDWVQTTGQPSEDFQGKSIFSDLAQQEPEIKKPIEPKNQVISLAKNMKSLDKLFNQRVSPTKVHEKAQESSSKAASLSKSLQSLQSELLAQKNEAHAKDRFEKGKQSRDVHWQSQFFTPTSGKNLSEGQQQALSQTFSKLQDQFRGCYETALLKFDELAVAASFEAEINQSGQVVRPGFAVTGRYTEDSKSSLVGCLTQVMSKIKVDSKLSGLKIKNQFIFKS